MISYSTRISRIEKILEKEFGVEAYDVAVLAVHKLKAPTIRTRTGHSMKLIKRAIELVI